jgi:hypothetical protein
VVEEHRNLVEDEHRNLEVEAHRNLTGTVKEYRNLTGRGVKQFSEKRAQNLVVEEFRNLARNLTGRGVQKFDC